MEPEEPVVQGSDMWHTLKIVNHHEVMSNDKRVSLMA
ncbi:unnamed protein product [Fusarium graminearum]|nr:hypothetical protein FG05_35154 [Fusarium graminearum]CZS74222.1 unnamed protein product [Fusarium graminearum]